MISLGTRMTNIFKKYSFQFKKKKSISFFVLISVVFLDTLLQEKVKENKRELILLHKSNRE